MKLEVLENHHQKSRPSKIIVNYSSFSQSTTVFIDADIVTIGLAARILTKKYEAYAATIEPKLRETLEKTLTEVCDEQD